MRIERIDDALERCTGHLSSAQSIDEEIENLLTQSILILICAEFERKLKGLVLERCSRISERPVRNYIGNYTRTALRSLRLSDLTGLLSRFGPEHSVEFRNRYEGNSIAATMYDSVWTNRNSVAHGEGSSATLGDVKRFYQEGHVVLDFFREALWLSAGPAGGE